MLNANHKAKVYFLNAATSTRLSENGPVLGLTNSSAPIKNSALS